MRVAIVHPWFPQYRKPFFDELIRIASDRGIQIDIFHGPPPPEWSGRGDAVSTAYSTELRTRFMGVGSRHLVFKSPLEVWRSGPHDLLILEQAVRNIETYAFLMNPKRTTVAFWGHGRTYTKEVGNLQERLKQYLTSKGDWFFSYTPGGKDAVTSAGFPSDRVTVLHNSIDASALQRSIDELPSTDAAEFSLRLDLRGKTGLFIGGLDESKRLDFLIEAADKMHALNSEFRLLIAGAGPLRDFVGSVTQSRPWITYLGPIFGVEKALAMRSADVLLMPGRVGLVAVDSFASQTPIATTDWSWHAPEFEYLENGVNALITADDVEAYSAAVLDVLSEPIKLRRLSMGAKASAQRYTVGAMAANFLDGIARWRERTR